MERATYLSGAERSDAGGHAIYVLNLIKYTDGRYPRRRSFRDGPFGDCTSRDSVLPGYLAPVKI